MYTITSDVIKPTLPVTYSSCSNFYSLYPSMYFRSIASKTSLCQWSLFKIYMQELNG